jgi:hypothetical protein
MTGARCYRYASIVMRLVKVSTMASKQARLENRIRFMTGAFNGKLAENGNSASWQERPLY